MGRERANALQFLIRLIERIFARFDVTRQFGNSHHLVKLGAMEGDKLHVRIAALTCGEDAIAEHEEVARTHAITCRDALHDFFDTRYLGSVFEHDVSGLTGNI